MHIHFWHMVPCLTFLTNYVCVTTNNTNNLLLLLLGLSRAAGDCLFDFKRKIEHIQTFTNFHCQWCGDTYTTRWGYGNLRTEPDPSSSSTSTSTSSSRSSFSFSSPSMGASDPYSSSTSSSSSSSALLEWKYVDKKPSEQDFAIALRLAPAACGWYAVKYPELSSSSSTSTLQQGVRGGEASGQGGSGVGQGGVGIGIAGGVGRSGGIDGVGIAGSGGVSVERRKRKKKKQVLGHVLAPNQEALLDLRRSSSSSSSSSLSSYTPSPPSDAAASTAAASEIQSEYAAAALGGGGPFSSGLSSPNQPQVTGPAMNGANNGPVHRHSNRLNAMAVRRAAATGTGGSAGREFDGGW